MDDIPICMICHNPTLTKKTEGVWVSNGITICCKGANCHEKCLTKYYQTSGIKCLLCRKEYPEIMVYTSPRLIFQPNGQVNCLIPGITNSCFEEPVWRITGTTNRRGITYINNNLGIDNSFQNISESEVLLANIDLNSTNEATLCEIGIALSQNLRIYLVIEPNITPEQMEDSVRRRLWYPIEASLTSLEVPSDICQLDFWFVGSLRNRYKTLNDYLTFLTKIHPKITVPVPVVSVSIDDFSDIIIDSNTSVSEHRISPTVIDQSTLVSMPYLPSTLPPRSNLPVISESATAVSQYSSLSESESNSPLSLQQTDYETNESTRELVTVSSTPNLPTSTIETARDPPSPLLTLRTIHGCQYYLDSHNSVYLTGTSNMAIGTYDPILDRINYENNTHSTTIHRMV